jgi:hypothetical protein
MKNRILALIEALAFMFVVFGIIGALTTFNAETTAQDVASLAFGLLGAAVVIAVVHSLRTGSFGLLSVLRAKATSPTRRLGFVLWCIGMPLTALGLIVLIAEAGDIKDFIRMTIEGMSFERDWDRDPAFLLSAGVWFDLAAAAAWWFESTIGRLFGWIRSGST